MIEFTKSRTEGIIRAVPAGGEYAIAHLMKARKRYRMIPLEPSYSASELRAIADKLDELNEETK